VLWKYFFGRVEIPRKGGAQPGQPIMGDRRCSYAMIERRDGEVIEYGMSEWSDVTTCDDDLQILYITILY